MRALRFVVPVVAALALLVAGAPPERAAASSEAVSVVQFARSQIGKPYQFGATGPNAYDCSGLVHRVFAATGLGHLVGTTRKNSRGYFDWFRNRGLVTSRPKPGDLVVWGNPVSHIGIYTGTSGGHPMAVSALVRGVREHRVHAVTTPFRAYLSVQYAGSGGGTGDTTVATAASATTAGVQVRQTTINLRAGSHNLFRLNSSGTVLEQRRINRSTSLAVTLNGEVRTFSGRPHARLGSGTWAGWWRRVPDAAPSSFYRFPQQRTLRLSPSTYYFKTFHANGRVVIRDHVRITQTTRMQVDARADFNGQRHFRIASGPLAGKWVARTPRVTLSR